MNDPLPPASPPALPVSKGWLAGGIIFIVVWLAGHGLWMTLSLIGSVMANDSGRVSNERHETLIFGLLAGQLLAGAAGIPGGLAFFWRKKRKALLWLAGGLFVLGVLVQVGAFRAFTSAWN
jgi:hypothetical protein